MGYAGETLAHASLVKSDPPSRAALAQSPTEVRLWFSEPIEPAYAEVSVLDARESAVVSGKGAVAKDNSRLVTLKLHPLAPGRYTVKYKVLSVDGHAVDSSYVFVIKPPPGAQ
jgi:copper resistance protein C